VTDTTSIEDKVIKIVCDQLSSTPDKVTRDTSFINDLGADSLDTVELVMELEDEFGVSIPDEDAEMISTVGTAVDYITAKGDGGGQAPESEGESTGSEPDPQVKA